MRSKKSFLHLIRTDKEFVKLKFNPRPYQAETIEAFNHNRFLLICWCRRLGKDMMAFYLACKECVENKNRIVYYVFNTMKQGKMMILEAKTETGEPIITETIDEKVIIKTRSGKLYHNDNTIRFKNGSIIYFVDAQNANTKVGGNLNLVVFSEMATYKNQEQIEYLIPSTLKVGGKIIAVSTPRYGSKFNDTVSKGESGKYISIIPATSDKAVDNEGNRIYSMEQLEYAKTLMSIEKYLQEYECDLNTANESSIYSQSISMAKYKDRVEWDKKRILISFDLGFNDGQSLVFSVVENGKVYPIHWYYTNNQPTKHYVDYIEQWLKAKGINKQQVELVQPHDANNRQDGYNVLVSRATMYRKAGFNVVVVPALPQLRGIEILRASIQNNDIIFENNPIITSMVNNLKKYEWKTTNGIIEFVPVHGKGLSSSNIADSLEYLAIYLFRNKYIEQVNYKNIVPISY